MRRKYAPAQRKSEGQARCDCGIKGRISLWFSPQLRASGGSHGRLDNDSIVEISMISPADHSEGIKMD